jgi:hypothetical protein
MNDKHSNASDEPGPVLFPEEWLIFLSYDAPPSAMIEK